MDLDLGFYHALMRVSEVAYLGIVAMGLWLVSTRHVDSRHRLIVAAFAVSVLFIGIQVAVPVNNHWVNVVWPRFQGGLFLAAMTSKPKYRVALTVAPAAVATWLNVFVNGLTPFAEKMVEVSVFAAVIVMASRQRDPWLRWAMMLYCLPTVMLSPSLAALATQGAWESWVSLFEIVHLGRIAGIVLCAAWFWRSTAPRKPQLELWPA